jgi:methylmalonyl-CoA/ethylmalonyl-CoA epimerase
MAHPRNPSAARSAAPDIALDHVAFGVGDVEEVTPLLVDELGGRASEGGPGAGFLFWQWRYAGGGRIEVIRPHGPPGGFLHRFLAQRGPGIHHVTFKVSDLASAAERARALDYTVVGYDDSNPGWKEFFLHPKQAQGIVVQLAESIPALDNALDPDWRFPAAGANPPPPVALVALQLSARSGAAARRQWGALLGGLCQEAKNELRFRWNDSPIQIAVQIDPTASEGPLAIEVAANRPLRLPEGRDPVLGARFLRTPLPPV